MGRWEDGKGGKKELMELGEVRKGSYLISEDGNGEDENGEGRGKMELKKLGEINEMKSLGS